MSRPSIEKRVLPGKVAVQEALEDLDLRDAVEQFERVDRVRAAAGTSPASAAWRSHSRSSGTKICA